MKALKGMGPKGQSLRYQHCYSTYLFISSFCILSDIYSQLYTAYLPY